MKILNTSEIILLFLIQYFFNGVLVAATIMDNELLGTPVIDCEDSMLSLTFRTKKPFTGRVYVRGLANDDQCSRNFANNMDQNKFSMIIQNGDCTMQRQRVTGSMEGIMFSLTIVVSFHGTFVTRADRAYRCMCFFRNIKRLTSGIDMSQIGTTELLDTAKMPTCTYSIHSGSADGPTVFYGQVGEKIYHVWECDDEKQGFLVHSCFVSDGRGTRFDLLDLNGCAIDPIIQPDVQYNSDLTRAVAETWGYKFSDTSVLNYQCVIELCKKITGECEGLSPPICTNNARKKRNVTINHSTTSREISNLHETQKMDVIAMLSMLDNIEVNGIVNSQSRELMKKLIQHDNGGPGFEAAKALVTPCKMCLTNPVLGALITVLTLMLTFSSFALFSFYRKSRKTLEK